MKEFDTNETEHQLLERLKWDLYEWCGSLSINELMQNDELVNELEKSIRSIERKLCKK